MAKEARDDEREAVDRMANGDLRVTDVLGRTARLHWSRFHGLIISMDTPAVYLGQPETLAWIAEALGDRKHPEPEWEYGVTTKWGVHEHPHLAGAERYAQAVREEIEQGRASGDLDHHGRIMRRTKAIAGPWVPAEEGENRG